MATMRSNSPSLNGRRDESPPTNARFGSAICAQFALSAGSSRSKPTTDRDTQARASCALSSPSPHPKSRIRPLPVLAALVTTRESRRPWSFRYSGLALLRLSVRLPTGGGLRSELRVARAAYGPLILHRGHDEELLPAFECWRLFAASLVDPALPAVARCLRRCPRGRCR